MDVKVRTAKKGQDKAYDISLQLILQAQTTHHHTGILNPARGDDADTAICL